MEISFLSLEIFCPFLRGSWPFQGNINLFLINLKDIWPFHGNIIFFLSGYILPFLIKRYLDFPWQYHYFLWRYSAIVSMHFVVLSCYYQDALPYCWGIHATPLHTCSAIHENISPCSGPPLNTFGPSYDLCGLQSQPISASVNPCHILSTLHKNLLTLHFITI